MSVEWFINHRQLQFMNLLKGGELPTKAFCTKWIEQYDTPHNFTAEVKKEFLLLKNVLIDKTQVLEILRVWIFSLVLALLPLGSRYSYQRFYLQQHNFSPPSWKWFLKKMSVNRNVTPVELVRTSGRITLAITVPRGAKENHIHERLMYYSVSNLKMESWGPFGAETFETMLCSFQGKSF